MKDIDLQAERAAFEAWFEPYWNGPQSDLAAWSGWKARAAVEADRSQRVPDGKPMFWVRLCSDGMYEGPIHDKQLEDVRRNSGAWSPLYLASTPAPAQQEPDKPMDAHRAAYFMRRFLHEEKMLGPNEQAALHFTIAALEAMESAAQHQEPPQQERKPMTNTEIISARSSGYDPEDEPEPWSFRIGVYAAERHHGIKE